MRHHNLTIFLVLLCSFCSSLLGQNNSLHFDGGNDIVNTTYFPPAANYTIEAWVKVNGTGPDRIVRYQPH